MMPSAHQPALFLIQDGISATLDFSLNFSSSGFSSMFISIIANPAMVTSGISCSGPVP